MSLGQSIALVFFHFVSVHSAITISVIPCFVDNIICEPKKINKEASPLYWLLAKTNVCNSNCGIRFIGLFFFSFPSVFLVIDFRFDRDWKKIEAFVGSKTVIQVIIIKVKGKQRTSYSWALDDFGFFWNIEKN